MGLCHDLLHFYLEDHLSESWYLYNAYTKSGMSIAKSDSFMSKEIGNQTIFIIMPLAQTVICLDTGY